MARKQNPPVALPHKVYLGSAGTSAEMTPEQRGEVSKKCARALVRWAKNVVRQELGL